MTNLGKITVITPPDKLFNLSVSYLLVKPSIEVKKQFQTILSSTVENITLFVFDQNDTDIDWMLSVAVHADTVIIDIDNCDQVTRQFITYLLAHPHVYYITSDKLTPYGLISRNQIYDLSAIAENFEEFDDFDDFDDESQEPNNE